MEAQEQSNFSSCKEIADLDPKSRSYRSRFGQSVLKKTIEPAICTHLSLEDTQQDIRKE